MRNWNFEDSEFQEVLLELMKKGGTSADGLVDIYNDLDEKVKKKIKHTILHNRCIRVLCSDMNHDRICDVRYHDMDKVITYLATNKIEKSIHKRIANHHHPLSTYFSGDEGESFEVLDESSFVEKLLDFECSRMSKPKKGDNAIEYIQSKRAGISGMKSIGSFIDHVRSYGFKEESIYKKITSEEYSELIGEIEFDKEMASFVMKAINHK